MSKFQNDVMEFFEECGEQVIADFGEALDKWREEQNEPNPVEQSPLREDPEPVILTTEQKKKIVKYFLDTSVKGLFEDGVIEFEKEEDYESYKLAVYMFLEDAQDTLNMIIDTGKM